MSPKAVGSVNVLYLLEWGHDGRLSRYGHEFDAFIY
jgi:hypothetical protein